MNLIHPLLLGLCTLPLTAGASGLRQQVTWRSSPEGAILRINGEARTSRATCAGNRLFLKTTSGVGGKPEEVRLTTPVGGGLHILFFEAGRRMKVTGQAPKPALGADELRLSCLDGQLNVQGGQNIELLREN